MTQWCCVTGQAGHWLFVSIQINHSLFWTDNAINAQKGHRVYSSQTWCGEQGGQRSKWTPLTDGVTQLAEKRVRKKVFWYFFVKEELNDWQWSFLLIRYVFLTSPVTGHLPKVLRLFVVLIDIPVGKISPQMPYIWQGLYSLMIRVNMAHGLHFYRRAGKNNTIAKIQPICEKKQQETALNGPECTTPKGATSITVTRPKRRTLGEVIAEMEMAVCVFVCVFVHAWVCFCASV